MDSSVTMIFFRAGFFVVLYNKEVVFIYIYSFFLTLYCTNDGLLNTKYHNSKRTFCRQNVLFEIICPIDPISIITKRMKQEYHTHYPE